MKKLFIILLGFLTLLPNNFAFAQVIEEVPPEEGSSMSSIVYDPNSQYVLQSLVDAPYTLTVQWDMTAFVTSNDEKGINFWTSFCGDSTAPIPVNTTYEDIDFPEVSYFDIGQDWWNCPVSPIDNNYYIAVGWHDFDNSASEFTCRSSSGESAWLGCLNQPNIAIFELYADKNLNQIMTVSAVALHDNTCNQYSPFMCYIDFSIIYMFILFFLSLMVCGFFMGRLFNKRLSP